MTAERPRDALRDLILHWSVAAEPTTTIPADIVAQVDTEAPNRPPATWATQKAHNFANSFGLQIMAQRVGDDLRLTRIPSLHWTTVGTRAHIPYEQDPALCERCGLPTDGHHAHCTGWFSESVGGRQTGDPS